MRSKANIRRIEAHEHAFLADLIRANGHETLLIDVGTGGPPQVKPDVTRTEVAFVASVDLDEYTSRGDRGECVTVMASAAPRMLEKLFADGRIDAVEGL